MTAAPPPPPRQAPKPPAAALRAFQQIPCAWGVSTVLPDWDVETYSEAGFQWNEALQKWEKLDDAPKGKTGLPAVGAAVYLQHPTAEVLCMAYDLKDGRGRRRWKEGDPLPRDLLQYLATFDPTERPSYQQRGLIEAHNAPFELRAYLEVLHARHGWPKIDPRQMRCSMAKARAFAMPGGLGELGKVLELDVQKDTQGKNLLKRFSIPRTPTKGDPRRRIRPADDPVGAGKLYDYNETDIATEAEASLRLPDLIPQELDYWLADLACNMRGIGVDSVSVRACIAVLEQALNRYNGELYQLTGGEVARASEVEALTRWLSTHYHVHMAALDEEAIEAALPRLAPHPPGGLSPARRALEIRLLIASASVKKVYAMGRMAARGDRLHDLYIFHGARTGRDTHADVQPGNLPKAGPQLRKCGDVGCGRYFGAKLGACPWCAASAAFADKEESWTAEAVEDALQVIRCCSLDMVEMFFGDALLTLAGCVRGLLVAAPGHDLICSDYSSIEAVVTAMLSGEQWRIDAFRRGDCIYLRGAAAITGKSYEWYVENGGKKHPDRQKIGKVSELALGFMGWVNAWRNFDKSDNYTDDEVKGIINKWRAASPAIVELAGGQLRGKPWKPDRMELFGFEGAWVNAVQNPGEVFDVRGIKFQMLDDALFVTLLSGRRLTYHSPRLAPVQRFDNGPVTQALTYKTWNTNPKMGPVGWVPMDTYSGKLIENIVQATARDVMAHAVVNLEAAGYPVVLRVHDEIASEVPEGFGSVEEFERVMATLPDWCADWPIRAAGGWRGSRYKKD